MDEFIWRTIKTLKVPEPAGSAWTPALDHVLVKRVYRITASGKWTVGEAKKESAPDGVPMPETRTQELVCAGSPFGALIAKIGGSTADKTGSVFAVGRCCVFQFIEDAKVGPLYLGANDIAAAPASVDQQIDVKIEIAL